MSTPGESSQTSDSTTQTRQSSRTRSPTSAPPPPSEPSTSAEPIVYPYPPRFAGISIFSRLRYIARYNPNRSETRRSPTPPASKEKAIIPPLPERSCVLVKASSESTIDNIDVDIPISTQPPIQRFEGIVMFTKSIERSNRTRSLEIFRKIPEFGEVTEEEDSGSNSHKKDHLYKILVIGDLGTGKTSIIKRYVHRFFTQHYRATIGVDFALKVMNWDEHTTIRLQLWDIAGQERYGNMTRVYYKEAVGAFIVFDVTRRTTFESVVNWKADLDAKVQLPDGSPIPCVLLANKCDQQKEGLVTNPTKMEEYCNENGFAAWLETSARDNINIDEAAKTLVQKILEVDNIINKNKGGDQFTLTAETNAEQSKKKCQC